MIRKAGEALFRGCPSKDSCALSGLGLVNETIVITVMAAFAYELPSLRSGLQLNSAGGVVFPFRNVEPLQSWSELVFRDLEQAIEASKEKQKRTPLFLPQNTYKYVCKVFTNLREKLYLKQNYLVKSEFF